MTGQGLSLETLTHPNYRGLVDTLEATPIDSPPYRAAVLAYFEALIRDQEERLESPGALAFGRGYEPRRHQAATRGRRDRKSQPRQRF